MTKLTFKKISMPSANMGDLNCLPDIHNNSYIRAPMTLTDNITQDERKLIGKGLISTLLPYQIQDQYDRSRDIKEFDAAILENDYLIATFIPELGGRLWSLYNKKENRELLYDNNVFQPANLALRNAWFSGGVEWNVGIKGHNPLTCSPMFALKATNKDGEPILKMYEFERIREVVYSLCATLKDDTLLINTTIENTSDNDKYMYWWSNIAVDETPDTRVIVPTDKTFICAYSDGAYLLDTGNLPINDGKDITYSVNAERSRDFFYKIPDNESKWIAAVKGDGKGLIQFSDNTLKGRKMFLWGQQNGGKHWNNWLSDRGNGYIEIQAGILKTQLEHFIMEKNSTLNWTEAYSMVAGDPAILHGKDYIAAGNEVASKMQDRFKLVYGDTFDIVNEDAPTYFGSGWGALENKIRDKAISNSCVFPEETMDYEQKDWLDLLTKNELPIHKVDDTIDSYVVGDFWINKLENIANKDWYAYNHLGILYYVKGDYEKSAQNFRKSIENKNNAWALRNLAQIEGNINKNLDKAAELMLEAVKIKSDYIPLLSDCANALLNNKQYDKWIEVYESLDEKIKTNGRLRMLLCLCYVKTDMLEKAKGMMVPSFKVDDMKEGEYALSAIWTELYAKILAKERGVDYQTLSDKEVLEAYPLPYELDFRMH